MRLFLLLLLATLASSDTVVYGLNGVIIKDNFNAQTTASSEVRYIHKYYLLFIEVRSKKKAVGVEKELNCRRTLSFIVSARQLLLALVETFVVLSMFGSGVKGFN